MSDRATRSAFRNEARQKTRRGGLRPAVCCAIGLIAATWSAPVAAQELGRPPANRPAVVDALAPTTGLGGLPNLGGMGGPEQWTSREGLSSALQVMLLLTVISLAPAILLMTTSFIRIVVVWACCVRRSARSSYRPAR